MKNQNKSKTKQDKLFNSLFMAQTAKLDELTQKKQSL